MAITPDLLNGALEFASACLTLINVRRLIIDKRVAGVSLIPIVLFDTWGFWNMYYYPALGQWWSFMGGCFLVAFNVWWTALAIYYTRKNCPHSKRTIAEHERLWREQFRRQFDEDAA